MQPWSVFKLPTWERTLSLTLVLCEPDASAHSLPSLPLRVHVTAQKDNLPSIARSSWLTKATAALVTVNQIEVSSHCFSDS